MKILLNDCSYQWQFYVALSEVFARHGAEVVIITFSHRRAAHYIKHGCRCRLLSGDSGKESKGSEIINHLESKFTQFRIMLVLRRDRFLWWRKRKGLSYLKSFAHPVEQLLMIEKPDLVIGEISTAFEYMFYFIAADMEIPYRKILQFTTKTPMIGLFDFGMSSEGSRLASGHTPALNELHDYPTYTKLLARLQHTLGKRLTGRSLKDYVHEFYLTYSKNDYRTHLSYKLRLPIIKIYRVIYHWIEAVFSTTIKPESKAVIFALHVQPEASPDFVSLFWADQLRLAEKLSEALPKDITLYIKEHPTTISLRNPIQYILLLLKPNVKMLKRKASMSNLLPNCKCVVTVCGTAALEAARFGVPAICFSDIYLKRLENVIDGRYFPSIADAFQCAFELNCKPLSDFEIEQCLSDLGERGTFQDIGLSPEVMNQNNLEALYSLVDRFVRYWRKEQSV